MPFSDVIAAEGFEAWASEFGCHLLTDIEQATMLVGMIMKHDSCLEVQHRFDATVRMPMVCYVS